MPREPHDHDGETPDRTYLRDEVFRRLKDHIVELAGSTTVPITVREADLAREFGVSRTPIREALSQLARDGLIEQRPRRGVRVIPMNLEEYVAWLEIREVLEGIAARLAAQHATDEQLAAMRELFDPFKVDELVQEDISVAYARANARFHSMIVEASGNRLIRAMAQTYDHMGTTQLRIIARLSRSEASLKEHLEMIEALERRDPGEAENLARQHVKTLRQQVLNGMRDLSPK